MAIDEKVLAHIKDTVERGIMDYSSASERSKWGLGEIEAVEYNGRPGAKVPVKNEKVECTIVFLYDEIWDLFEAYTCAGDHDQELVYCDGMLTTWDLSGFVDEFINQHNK